MAGNKSARTINIQKKVVRLFSYLIIEGVNLKGFMLILYELFCRSILDKWKEYFVCDLFYLNERDYSTTNYLSKNLPLRSILSPMHESLIKYIENHSTTPLTASEIEVIKDVFVPKKIRKRQYFLQEGEVCKYSGFIVKGAMRQYSVDAKGAEHIVRLSIENWWAGDRESFVMLTPSIYNIDAWQNTDALLITRADILN